jgi:nitrate reductase gamma subunit
LGLLLLGHLAGLFFPRWVLTWNTGPTRLYLLELVAFASGVAALLGWLGLLWRHLGRSSAQWAAEMADTAFLSLFGLALGSGLATAALHRWGSSWGVVTLTPYARSLLRGRPVTELASQLPFLARLHMAAAFAALALVPATRLGVLLVVALHRVLEVMGKPIAPCTRVLEAWLRKHDPRPWIWPDED